MLYNRDYGKLTENNLEYAPRNIQIDLTWYIPGQEEHYLQAGYLHIVHTPCPDDGKYYESHWGIVDGHITEVWEEKPIPPEPEPEPDPFLDLQEATIDHEYRITLLELGV